MLRTHRAIPCCIAVIVDTHWDDFNKKRTQIRSRNNISFGLKLQPFQHVLQLHKTLNTIYTPDNVILSKESAFERWNVGLCIVPWCANTGCLKKGMCLKHYNYMFAYRKQQGTIRRRYVKYPHRRLTRRRKHSKSV